MNLGIVAYARDGHIRQPGVNRFSWTCPVSTFTSTRSAAAPWLLWAGDGVIEMRMLPGIEPSFTA